MKVLSLLLAAAMLALANAHGCPPMWTRLAGDCYRYFGFPRPMRIAERVCAQFTSCSGAASTAVSHLPSIENIGQDKFLRNLVESVAAELPPVPVWMGLNDIVREGDFKHPDGKPYIFKNWERGHPNNQGNADCMAMPGERGGWININCMEELAYICKMPADTEGEMPPVQPGQPGFGQPGFGGQPYLAARLLDNSSVQ